VFGLIQVHAIELSNCIFRTHHGRPSSAAACGSLMSYLIPDAATFPGQPDLVERTIAQKLATKLRSTLPQLTASEIPSRKDVSGSRHPATMAHAMAYHLLSARCDLCRRNRTGADDESEMGCSMICSNPARGQLACPDEYVPAGSDVGIILAS
jgi:hypothetical protein